MAGQYLQLALDAAMNVEGCTSWTNESPVKIYKLQCQLISQMLVESVKDVWAKMHHERISEHLEVLKDFYRTVKDVTNLIHLCCDAFWFNVAVIFVDATEAFALKISEVIWCTNVILGTGDHSTIPGGQLEESDWKARLERAACQDQRMLRSRLEQLLAEKSRSEPESCKIVRVLLHRLHESGDATEVDTDENPTYPDLKEMRHELRRESKPLGKGSFGTVSKTTWREESYALKEYFWCDVGLFVKEATVAAKLHHPNVVSLIGCFVEGNDCSLLMELMSKNLSEYMKERRSGWLNMSKVRLGLPIALDIMLQIAEGMRYLHQKNVAHRDVKPHNILVSPVLDKKLAKEGYVTVKLADFGSAKPNVESATLMETLVGTLLYRAPEIGRAQAAKPGSKPGSDVYSRRADVYSFAVICYEILSGERPFPPEALPRLQSKILQGDRPQFKPGIRPHYLSVLIGRCWDGDAGKRPAFTHICVELRRIKCFVLTGRYEEVSMERSLRIGPHDLLEEKSADRPTITQVVKQFEAPADDSNLVRAKVSLQDEVNIVNLIDKISGLQIEVQRDAAEQLRVLTRRDSETRNCIAEQGAIPRLVDLLVLPDKNIQEHVVTALLHLSKNNNIREEIIPSGAASPIIRVLRKGSLQARETAAATLFSLSLLDRNKVIIGNSGAIPHLVDLLRDGTSRGKMDAARALLSLFKYEINTLRAVEAGIVPPLMAILVDPASGMLNKALPLLAHLSTHSKGRIAICIARPTSMLMHILKVGSRRNQENAACTLLAVCSHDPAEVEAVKEMDGVEILSGIAGNGTFRARRMTARLLKILRKQESKSEDEFS